MSIKNDSPTLRGRVLRSGSWVLSGHIAAQSLRLGSNLVMTRLLVPEMFGLMALASVLITGLSLFSDVGLRQNIIQSSRGNEPDFLNTAWTVQILRGAFICLLALILAFVLYSMGISGMLPENSTYAEPILPYIIAVLSSTALINGFESTKLATANRNIFLGRVIRNELLGQLAGLIFMITWAFNSQSIWALVYGSLFASMTRMLLSHFAMPGSQNKLQMDSTAFWEIFHFGKWIFISSILGFLAINGDRLILGGLVDSTTLGLYAIASLFLQAVVKIVIKIISGIAFPTFSEVVRDRPYELKNIYYKFRFSIDLITLTAAGFLFMAGHSIVDLLYDDRYLDAGYMLEVLSIGLIMVRYNLVTQCMLALGKPKILVLLVGARFIVIFTILPVSYLIWGFDGMLWAIALHGFVLLPIFIYLKIKFLIFDFGKEIKLIPLLFIGLAIGWATNIFI